MSSFRHYQVLTLLSILIAVVSHAIGWGALGFASSMGAVYFTIRQCEELAKMKKDGESTDGQ